MSMKANFIGVSVINRFLFALYVFLFLLLGIITYVEIRGCLQSVYYFNDISEITTQKLGLLVNIRKNETDIQSALLKKIINRFYKTNDIAYIVGKEEKTTDEYLDEYKKLVKSSKEETLFNKVLQNKQASETIRKQLLGSNAVNKTTALVLYTQETIFQNYQNSISDLSNYIARESHAKVQNIRDVIQRAHQRIKVFIIIRLGVLVLLCVFVFNMSRSLIKRNIAMVKKDIELRESRQLLRDLASHQQNIIEEERTYIAREIHDELGQAITGIKMEMTWLKKHIDPENTELSNKVNETINTLDDTVKTIRKIASALRPSVLDDIGLTSAIAWQCKEFEKKSHIKCTFSHPAEEVDPPVEIKTSLFRICQESLTNVMRYSQATETTISLNNLGNKIILTVTDNGKGFDTTQKTKSFGILGMKERCVLINASFKIKSTPGEGTSVIVEASLPA